MSSSPCQASRQVSWSSSVVICAENALPAKPQISNPSVSGLGTRINGAWDRSSVEPKVFAHYFSTAILHHPIASWARAVFVLGGFVGDNVVLAAFDPLNMAVAHEDVPA